MRSRLLTSTFLLLSLAGIPAPAQQYPEKMYQEMRWRMIGPFRGGRTRAAAGVPAQPNVFYIGAADGGIWKSNDYGRTWNPIFDQQTSQSIGAIAVAPSDPSVIYVASGEGLHRPDLSVGDGIYKSVDAGKTWAHLGLRDGKQIPALAIDPRNPNRLFAAVLGHPYGPNEERGIFRSLNGGETWQKIFYKDANTGGADVEIDPSNPDVIFASLWEVREGPWEDNNLLEGNGGGLFKSTDGGDHWAPMTSGLPADVSQINFTIAPGQPTRLYATVANITRGDYGTDQGVGFYRSDDAGENWTRITTDPRPAMRIGGGDLPVPRVDPKNPDVVYSASIVTTRSTDGGKTWMSLRGAPGGDDYQNLWINPNDPNIILLVSDQGAIVTVNGGETWSSWFNQPTAQLYHVAVTGDFPYRVCAGQQESGSVCIASRGNDGEINFRDSHPVGVIEYGYVAPDPLDRDVIFGAGRNEVSKFHWSTGQVENITPIPVRGEKYRTDRTEPLIFSPIDPHTLFYAANFLFKTDDGGNTWQTISPDLSRESPGIPNSVGDLAAKNPKAGKQRGAIYALAPSFRNVNTLWAGTDDGLVWKTLDAGKDWQNITPPDLTPWSKVTQIAASRFDDASVYVSVSRFRIDDLRPYIYRTHDGGRSWKLITEGLPPDAPVDTVREDSVRRGLLFAGTETAAWMSFDDGDHWQSLQLNLPHTSMRDLWVHDNDLIVATHGRSFWILDDITPLRQLDLPTPPARTFLYHPATAYRIRRDTNTDTPIPPDEPAGANPPDGAVIDYFLAQQSAPILLEVLDAQGKLVRRFSSTDQPETTQAELEKQLIPMYWLRLPKTLPASEGMHRWVWDLHYPPPPGKGREYPISAVPHDTPSEPQGPLALPGQYTARLTAGGKTFSAPLTVKMDPRVDISQADLIKQFNLAIRLSLMMTTASQAATETRSTLDQLQAILQKASGPVAESVKTLQQKVSVIAEKAETDATASENRTLKSLNADIAALYANLERADTSPTAIVADTSEITERDLSVLLKRWEELKRTDLAEINRQLAPAGLPAIKPDLKPKTIEDAHEE